MPGDRRGGTSELIARISPLAHAHVIPSGTSELAHQVGAAELAAPP